jgi:hypothetical protein
MCHATAQPVARINISACLTGVGAGEFPRESGNLPDTSGEIDAQDH